MTKCYRVWSHALERTNPNGSWVKRHPAYHGCTLDSRWIFYQDFAEWYHHQNGIDEDGWHLDKDIIVPGNKVYGPDTCCFVPQSLNKLLTHNKSSNGDCVVGVHYKASIKKYGASISIDSIRRHIGYFKTQEEASDAYQHAKLKEIHRQANLYKGKIDQRAYDALIKYRF